MVAAVGTAECAACPWYACPCLPLRVLRPRLRVTSSAPCMSQGLGTVVMLQTNFLAGHSANRHLQQANPMIRFRPLSPAPVVRCAPGLKPAPRWRSVERFALAHGPEFFLCLDIAGALQSWLS
jgi:hypothetical protein